MTYLYHKTHGAKIFKDEEVEDMEKEGWVDTPAKIALTPLKDNRISGEPIVGGYESLNIPELKAICKKRGFLGYGQSTKEKLIERIVEDDEKAK